MTYFIYNDARKNAIFTNQKDLLDGGDWTELLKNCPEFIKECDLEKLSSWQWCVLLSRHNELRDYCDFSKITHAHFKSLCHSCPQYLDVYRKYRPLFLLSEE